MLTATVGGTSYAVGTVADRAEDNRQGSMGPLTVGAAAPAGSTVSVSDIDQGTAIDNDLLTGVAGGTAAAAQTGGLLSLRWNSSAGGFTDNDADPDFFVFEDGGNDNVVVHAILGDGTLGAGVALSGWNEVRTDGVLNGGALTGRSVAGVAFHFTDLLDAVGSNLTNGTIIRGVTRGTGGPWKNTTVTAGQPSDPYLMYGYDRKVLTLSAADAATITIEVDFLADNTWSIYRSFSLPAGETLTHLFPEGFQAHWVRVKSDTSTTATAQFTYGPADQRDAFLDWGRDQGLPTGAGRAALADSDSDQDGLVEIFEFLFGTDPGDPNPWPLTTDATAMSVVLRDLSAEDGIHVT